MADRPDDAPEPAELRTIRQLVRLMAKYDLTAIDLGEGPGRVRLRRRGAESTATPPAGLPANLGSAAAAPAPVLPAPSPPPAPVSSGVFIESPMVGTFYASNAPDAPPYVSSGSKVTPDSTVCVIEAMKVFTDIPAGVSGTVVEVLVKNGQPVEFGQPLFRVEPA